MEKITFEEFKKIEMKVGKILSAEKVEGSDKLLKLMVDFGETEIGREVRQIISGIAKSYEPEFLAGKQAVFVTNLEPRQIMGLESNGMILCPQDANDLPVIIQPEKEVLPGSAIK